MVVVLADAGSLSWKMRGRHILLCVGLHCDHVWASAEQLNTAYAVATAAFQPLTDTIVDVVTDIRLSQAGRETQKIP